MPFKNYHLPILIFAIFLILLLIRFLLYFSTSDELLVGESVEIEHVFLEVPKKNSFGQYFFIDSVLVSLPQYPEFKYGDKILIKGVVAESVSSNESNLTKRLIIDDPEVKLVEDRGLAVLSFIRQKVLSSFKSALPPREAGLLAGIVLGAEEGISDEFEDELKRTGMLHVVVASGSNVVLVAGVIFGLVSTHMKKSLTILFTILGIFLYALLTGFDPPIVRASIMASFGLIALALGRQRVALVSLLFSAWLMLVVSPRLVADIGFLLSFSATLGIILFQKILFTLTKIIPNLIKEDFATTLAAQIGAMPFLLIAFGEVNLFSIFINVVLLWTVPIIMIFGLIAGVVGLVLPIVSFALTLLIYPFLAFFSITVELTSNLYLPLSLTSIFLPVAILYYLFMVWFLLNRRKA